MVAFFMVFVPLRDATAPAAVRHESLLRDLGSSNLE
jgi:hypothetical protein